MINMITEDEACELKCPIMTSSTDESHTYYTCEYGNCMFWQEDPNNDTDQGRGFCRKAYPDQAVYDWMLSNS